MNARKPYATVELTTLYDLDYDRVSALRDSSDSQTQVKTVVIYCAITVGTEYQL